MKIAMQIKAFFFIFISRENVKLIKGKQGKIYPRSLVNRLDTTTNIYKKDIRTDETNNDDKQPDGFQRAIKIKARRLKARKNF